jgi:S1-C subfamily serine protease
MTNAHVVAGVEDPTVQVDGVGRMLSASVVYFDPAIDVAVLAVPDLTAVPLRFGGVAGRGSDAVVAGFPGGGKLTAEAARVRGRITAQGQDIHGTGPVTRDIYSLRSRVLPGNSGGPLLSPAGLVYGVVFAAASRDSSTGYALTADEVAAAAAAGRKATQAVPTGSCIAG